MKQRLLSMLLAATLLFSLALSTSCGDKKQPERSRVTHVYRSNDIALPEQVSYYNSMYVSDGELILRATEVLDEEKGEWRDVLLTVDLDSGDYTMEIVPEIGVNQYVSSILPLDGGDFLYVIVSYDPETWESQHSLWRYDGETFTTLTDDAQSLFTTDMSETEYYTGDFYLQYVRVDGDGNFYLATENVLGVFDAELNRLFELELPGWLNNLSKTADGRVFIEYYDREVYEQVVRFLDVKTKSLGEELQMPEGNQFSNADFYLGDGYDLYLDDGSSVWGYQIGEEPVELLNWINSDIIANNVRDLVILDADHFIASYREYREDGNDISELYLLERVPDEEVPERYIIDLAVQYVDYDLPSQVVKFNRSNEEYRVRITDYQQYITDEDYEAGETQLYNDIKANHAPDVILLSDFSNSSTLITEGAFADLYEFMEKDASFDKSALFDCVYEPFEVKGKLYQLVTSITLSALAAKSANVPGESWTVDEFLDWAEAQPEGTYVMDYTSQLSMLNQLLSCSFDQFVDEDTGKVNFDNATFRRILEYAKNTDNFSYRSTLSGDALADYENDRYKAYREDTILLYESYIYDLGELVDTMFAFGFEDTTFIGYPTSENGAGIIASPNTSYAIVKDSPIADGAWEFLKTAALSLSSEFTGRGDIPASREAFRASVAEEMKMHYFYYYDGGRSGSSSDSFIGRYDESEGIYRDFTNEDAALLESLLDKAAPTPVYAEKILDLVMEDLEMYFAGEKTLDETVAVIQSRAGLYIAENS